MRTVVAFLVVIAACAPGGSGGPGDPGAGGADGVGAEDLFGGRDSPGVLDADPGVDPGGPDGGPEGEGLEAGPAKPLPLVLKAIEPASGPVAGGTTVTLQGTGFLDGMDVRFSDARSPSVFVLSDTLANAVAPAHAPGAVPVRVVIEPHASALQNAYTYEAALRLAAVEPSRGTANGGTPVVLRGAGFAPGATVLFGGREAILVRPGDDGTLLAVTPPQDPGPVSVLVIQGADRARLDAGFTFDPAPVLPSSPDVSVGAVLPASGPPAGGTPVRILGAGFQPGASVRFGGLPATQVEFVNETTLRAVTPPGSAGPVDVAVRMGYAETILPSGFEYEAQDVGVLAVEPDTGSWAGGAWVRIWGRGLGGTQHVYFGGAEAAQVRVRSSVLLEVRTPRSYLAGSVPVMVLGAGGALADAAFQYFDPRQSGGGTWGGPIRGDVNVTVLNGQTAKAVPDAYVILGADLHSPFQGLTDDRGQVTLSAFDLAGRQSVHATRGGFSAATIAGFDARNVTLYINPPPSPESPGQPPGGGSSSPCKVQGVVKDFDKWFLKPPGFEGEVRVQCWTPMTSLFGGTMDPGPGAVCDEHGRFSVLAYQGQFAVVCGLVASDAKMPGQWYPLRIGLARGVTCTKDQEPPPVEIALDHPTDAELWVNPGPLPTWPDGVVGPYFSGGWELGDDGWLDLLRFQRKEPDGRWVFLHQPRDFDGDLSGRGYGFFSNLSTMGTTGSPYSSTLIQEVQPPGSWPVLVGDPAGMLPLSTSLRQPVTVLAPLPSGDLLAADALGGLYRFDGTSFFLLGGRLPDKPLAGKAFAEDDWVFAGVEGSVWRVQAGVVTSLPTGAGWDLSGLDGESPDALEVGGGNFLMRYDGASFQLESLPGGTDVRAVRRYPDGQVVAVGRLGAVAVGRVGEIFSVLRPTTADLLAIDGPRDDAWIAGTGGVLLHLAGEDLTVYQAPTTSTFRGVLRLGGCDVLAFGDEGAAWRFDCQRFVDLSRPDLSVDLLAGALKDGSPVLAGRRWVGLPRFLAFPRMSEPVENQAWGRAEVAFSFPPDQSISYHQILLSAPSGLPFWNLIAGGDLRSIPVPDFASAIGYDPVPAGPKRLNLTSAAAPGFTIDRYTSSDISFYSRPSYAVWFGSFH